MAITAGDWLAALAILAGFGGIWLQHHWDVQREAKREREAYGQRLHAAAALVEAIQITIQGLRDDAEKPKTTMDDLRSYVALAKLQVDVLREMATRVDATSIMEPGLAYSWAMFVASLVRVADEVDLLARRFNNVMALGPDQYREELENLVFRLRAARVIGGNFIARVGELFPIPARAATAATPAEPRTDR
jgi:hypothetical protein